MKFNKQPAEWTVNEPPVELGDRTPHMSTWSCDAGGKWYISGASRRGKMHEHNAEFREDAFAFDYAANWILVAVADGAGSHHLSRVGANLAVKTALETMCRRIESQPPVESVVKIALEMALRESWKALFQEAERRKDKKLEFRDLSTTLMLLMYHPRKNYVGVAQIGGGLLAGQFEDGQVFLLGHPESGEYSGHTYFLTNHKPEDFPLKCEFLDAKDKQIRYFFVMTAGMADDLYPPKDKLPGLIKAIPAVMGAESPDKSLLELINYNRPGSFSDRTLVVVCKRQDVAAQAAREEQPTSNLRQPQQVVVQPKPIPPKKGTNTGTGSSGLDFGSLTARRMPVYFLLECSDSMRGAPIMAVEQGVQLLHNELSNIPQAVDAVHLSVVAYSTYAQQVAPLTPLPSFSSPPLMVGGTRNLGNALRVLGSSIYADLIRGSETAKGDYKALIFWITDGEPADDWQAGLKYFQERTSGLLGNFVALGAGDSVNMGIMRQITPHVLLMTDVSPENLRTWFKWDSQPAYPVKE